MAGHVFCWVYSVWGFAELLESIGLDLLPNLGHFKSLLFQILFFTTALVVLYFWNYDTTVGCFGIFPQVLGILGFFFLFCFFI